MKWKYLLNHENSCFINFETFETVELHEMESVWKFWFYPLKLVNFLDLAAQKLTTKQGKNYQKSY